MTKTLIPAFTRHSMIGTTDEGWNVYVTISWDGAKLSITGVEGPKANGDCRGSCGQIEMGGLDYTPAPGVDLQRLREVWDAWHMNDMQAGSPRQTLKVKEWLAEGRKYDYDKVCEMLKAEGLLYDAEYIHKDQPYRYGSAWLKIEVPDDALEFLMALPAATSMPICWMR